MKMFWATNHIRDSKTLHKNSSYFIFLPKRLTLNLLLINIQFIRAIIIEYYLIIKFIKGVFEAKLGF